jgi:hypothetical protein
MASRAHIPSGPCEPLVLGVEFGQLVDVAEQTRPASLVLPEERVIDGIEVTYQRTGELTLHHTLVSARSEVIPLPQGAERPHKAVIPILPPPGLLGQPLRARAHHRLYPSLHPLSPLRHTVEHVDYLATAQTQAVERPQIPSDGTMSSRPTSRREAIRLCSPTPERLLPTATPLPGTYRSPGPA